MHCHFIKRLCHPGMPIRSETLHHCVSGRTLKAPNEEKDICIWKLNEEKLNENGNRGAEKGLDFVNEA